MSTSRIARIAMIAAIYAALTLVCILFLGGLAWGPVQFRISEAACVLALFTADAIPGLTLGCIIANVANIALSGTGMLGMLDVVFGSLATFLGAIFTWHYRNRPMLALAGPVIANAFIVSAYLPLLLKGLGFYTVGEAVVTYTLGLSLYRALAKTSLPERLREDDLPLGQTDQA